MDFIKQYFQEVNHICERLDYTIIEKMINLIAETKERKGRLFILGVGGSAANASHAVNDFRKLVNIEAYAPTDNVSELTARTNDEGWNHIFDGWLRISQLSSRDLILVFSVGGGNIEKNVSVNLITALQYAKKVGARIIGVTGRDGGFTAQVADACLIIPTVNPDHITPHTEGFQSIIEHLIVSHPKLKSSPTKWESLK